MSFSMKGKPGNDRIFKKISDHERLTEQGIRDGMIDTGNDLVKTGRQLIRQGPKTGRLYRIPGRKRRHRASAPGEPPANLTGNLARGQGFKVRGFREMSYGEQAEYAPYLEVGTVKIEPRPHLIKSIEKNQKNTRNNFERRIKQRHFK